MSVGAAPGELELPRWLRRRGIPLGAVLLTLLFFVAGLPTDRFGAFASAKIRSATGADVTIRKLGVGLGLPFAISAEGVSLRFAGVAPIQLERTKLRPAWSFSWLRGAPAFAIDVAGPLGTADGVVTLGDEPGFDGAISGVALAQLPLGDWLPGTSADGTLALAGAVRRTAVGLRGKLDLDLRDGSVSLPSMPVALPFASLRGTIRFTDANAAELDGVTLEGPMLAGTVRGTVGNAASMSQAPLALTVHVEAREPSLRPLLAGSGLRVGPDGAADVTISGSVAAPSVQ